MRTVHHKNVSVHKRIKDIKDRYWDWSKENETLYRKCEEKILELEEELLKN